MPGSDLLLSRSASALVEQSAIEMTTADGGVVEIWTITADGPVVRASGPRLQVREGLELHCRLVIDGVPRSISAVIERAELQSATRAALQVRVVAAEGDGHRRRSRRLDAAVPVTLRPLVCDRLVPDDVLHGVIRDISEGGVAIAIADLRARPGDRLRMTGRAFEGVIDCELRATSVRAGERPGTQLVGCAFLDPSPELVAVVSRLRARLERGAAGVGVAAAAAE